MELTIFTPTKKEIIEVLWVELNTPTGNYVIQQGHAPTAFTLSPNKPLLYCLKNGTEVTILIQQATADISRMGVVILLNKVL